MATQDSLRAAPAAHTLLHNDQLAQQLVQHTKALAYHHPALLWKGGNQQVEYYYMQTDPHCFLNRAILASDQAYRALERQEQTALQAGDQAQAQALGAQLRERELKAFHAQRAKERACAGALGHMAAIGGVGYLTGGTGLPTYLLSMSAMSATSMALDPRLRRHWVRGDWPGVLAASQAHLPLWGPLRHASDAWERGAYVQAGLQAGALALDVAGLKGARNPGRLPAATVPKTTVKLDPKRTQHIFRNTEGHIKDTPANRKLLERIANDPNCKLGPDIHGNMYHGLTRLDGTQAWVIIRDGQITNGGINLVPKTYNSKTGLCAPTPPKQK